MLALLIALVSVLSIAGPPIMKLFEPRRSDVSMVIQEVSADRTIRVFVSNRGSKPAALGRAAMVIRIATHPEVPDGQVVSLPLDLIAGSSAMLPAGGAAVLTFSTGLPAVERYGLDAPEGVPAVVVTDAVEMSGRFVIGVYDFGETEARERSISIPPADAGIVLDTVTACYRLEGRPSYRQRCEGISGLLWNSP